MSGYTGIYTGKQFEEEILGQCLYVGVRKASYKESMELVKKHQPWSPADPKPKVANNLHALVALALGLKNWEDLKFFTAVGSPLDLHGVDGFFEFQGKVVTIDVTMNSEKENYRADFILSDKIIDNEEELGYFSKQVAEAFQGA